MNDIDIFFFNSAANIKYNRKTKFRILLIAFKIIDFFSASSMVIFGKQSFFGPKIGKCQFRVKTLLESFRLK